MSDMSKEIDLIDYTDEFHIKMLKQTEDFATMSKDKSTKVGASLLKNKQIHPEAWGYNGMVRGANDDLIYRNERPEKYLWTEHAERNIFFNEARKIIKGHTIFCSNFPTIFEARAIASSALSCVVTVLPDSHEKKHDSLINEYDVSKLKINEEAKNFIRVNQILNENNIKIIYPFLDKNNEDIKKINKYKDYLLITQKYAKRWCSEYIDDSSASLILDSNGYTPVAWGINDLPNRMKNNATEQEKSDKNLYIPAACNAIYETVKSVLCNSTLYASWCPCIDCSMAASQVGVSKIISKAPDFSLESDLRWKESFEKSLSFYNRIGMETKFFAYDEFT